MTLHLGKVKPGSTLYIPFDTFAGATGASITMTGLAVTDIEIYKNGSVTQRAFDTGYTLLDTDGIDFDALTGIHGFSVDLSSNADAGFFVAGGFYWVVVSAITVDTQTVSFVAATFCIGYDGALVDTTIATLATQTSFTLTAGPAEDDALNGCTVIIHDIASAVQLGKAIVLDYTGSTKTVTLVAGVTFTAAAGDNISILPPALQPSVWGGTEVIQTGDSFARIGATGSGLTSLASQASVDAVDNFVDTEIADIQARLPAALTADGNMKADTLRIGGTLQTGRDIGASVLLSSGTGTGQLDFTSGVVKSSLVQILGTALTETAGQIAAAFKQFFDVGTPTGTMKAITNVVTATNLTNLPTIPTNWLTADGLAADAVTEIQSGLSTAAALATVQADTDDIQARLPAALVGGKMDSDATAISGDTVAADNLEKEYDGTGYGHILQRTTIATLASQTSFTLTAGSADDNAYNNCIMVIEDASTAAQKAVAVIADYTGATKTITLLNDPAIFTIATTDIVTIIADKAIKPTVDNRTLDVSAGGEAGIDWANVGTPGSAVSLSATTISTLTTYTGNTPQTGDSFARIGVTGSGLTSLATQASVNTVDDFLDTEIAAIITTLGTPAGASISADIAAIEAQTDDIGAAGAGLTTVPWNAAWDAEVQSEVDDALVARNLDKLVIASGTADSGTTTTMVDAARTEADADYWKGRMIVFTSGNVSGQCAIITDFVTATDTFTFAPPLTQAVTTQTYVILPGVSVWDDTLAEHLISGSTGAALNAAGAAGDPWSTALPGAYGAGTAGKIVGDNINTTISSRSSHSAADVWAVTTRTLSAAGVQAIWDALTSALTTVGSIGKLIVDNLNATISSRSSHSAADVWASATRLLTAGTNIVLAKGTGVTGFNDLSAAQVNTEVDTAIADARLDELLAADSDIDGAAPPTVGSVVHELMSKTAGSFTYDQTTDSNEAIRDRGDAAWITATGFSTLTQADIRTATGLASANLDTQLTAIDDAVDTEVAAVLAAVDTEVAAIKAKTDNLPASPAAVGSQMDLVNAPNAIAVTAIQSGLAVQASVDDLEGRLTATRAGYLDNLSGGAVALASGVTVTTNNDKTGYALSAAAVDAILDEVVEGTYTMRQFLRLFASALGGELSGAATTTITIRDASDTKTRITATVDADGNRSAVTLDLT